MNRQPMECSQDRSYMLSYGFWLEVVQQDFGPAADEDAEERNKNKCFFQFFLQIL